MRVTVDDTIAIGPGKIALLQVLDETRSITAAAKALGLDFVPVATERYDLCIPTAFLDDRRVMAVLDPLRVVEVISKGAAQSWQMDNRARTMLAGEFDFGFAVDWMRKDLGLALDEARRLGVPLPKGRLRFYRQDAADGRLEFTGENELDHTPRNETVKIRLGEAFDVVGERIRSDFTIHNAAKRMTETFRIELRNQKSAAQKVRVIERPYRWTNWEITAKNTEFAKLDSGTIAFEVDVPSEGARTIEYTVRYSW